jgi:hypothetical protein
MPTGLGRQGILAVGEGLGAEAAADIAGDDADLVLRHPEHARQVVKVEVENQRLVTNYMETRSVVAEYDSGAKRFTHQTLVLDLDLHHLGGLGEGGVHRRLVAHGRVERDREALHPHHPEPGRARPAQDTDGRARGDEGPDPRRVTTRIWSFVTPSTPVSVLRRPCTPWLGMVRVKRLYDSGAKRFTLTIPSQGVHGLRKTLTGVLGVTKDLRVKRFAPESYSATTLRVSM